MNEIVSEYTAANGKTYSIKVYDDTDLGLSFGVARRPGGFGSIHTAMFENASVETVTAAIHAMADADGTGYIPPAIHFRRAQGNPENL